MSVHDGPESAAMPSRPPAEPRPTDPRPTDPRPTEPRPTDPRPTDPRPREDRPPTWRAALGRFAPAVILAAGLIAFFLFDLDRFLSFDALERYHDRLAALVDSHLLLAAAGYFLAYALATAFSVPGGAVLSIAGGFLFGLWGGTALAVTGATLGSVTVFLAARTAMGDVLRRKGGATVRRLEAGFRKDSLAYLFVLRLIPLFPFWLVNFVPALMGMRLAPYTLATFFGIMPGSFVYVSIGNGVGSLLARGESPNMGMIFKPEILTPIIGLAVLALLPVIYRKLRARRQGRTQE